MNGIRIVGGASPRGRDGARPFRTETRVLSGLLCALILMLAWNSARFAVGEPPAAEPAAAPPPINLAPGPEYADAARKFQGIPGIERASNGRLWATWYGGGVTEDEHNYIMLTTSGDDGKHWSPLKLVIDPDGDGPIRAYDPCLWHDPQGRLWLFWAQNSTERKKDGGLWAIRTENSGDENAQWSKPQWIATGVMMNKPTALSTGEWLLPAARWFREGSSEVIVSSDRGLTWRLLGRANVPNAADRNCDEPMIVERASGDLWMLVRTKYGIGESISTDRGRTWSDVSPTTLTQTVSRFCVRRLKSGRLLLVMHSPPPPGSGRSHLTAYVSEDDGKTWLGSLLLDERVQVSYPDAVESPQGLIYVIYDYARRGDKQIFMAVFTEQDVLRKKAGDATRLRVLVNQATGATPSRPAKTSLPAKKSA